MKITLTRSFLATLAYAALCLPSAFAQSTTRLSVDSAGVQGNQFSQAASLSADGRYAAFFSYADNLVPSDTNLVPDIFVKDRQTGLTTRVSVDSMGVQGNDLSISCSVSADGRFVVFGSAATNLVTGDTNGTRDAFVHDRQTGATTRVSVDSAGVQGNQFSAWASPSISADGRLVAFVSEATNLVPGDTNGLPDCFVHDRQTGQTIRVSVDSAGGQATGPLGYGNFICAISADGRAVAFESTATNLVSGDTNGHGDVFVHDLASGQTSRVSLNSAGAQGTDWSSTPSISANGRRVVFQSNAANLVSGDTNGHGDAFVHDRQTGQTNRISVDSAGGQGNGGSWSPAIAAGGRYVAFVSGSSNLVQGDTNGQEDIFVHDLQTGATTRVSVDSSGVQANASSEVPSISEDGRFIGFDGPSTNLVSGDTNAAYDVFVHDRGASSPSLARTGPCPGLVNLTISNATPGGMVAIVYGPAGIFVKPNQPCQGLILGVAPPTLLANWAADAAGVVSLNFSAPPRACGTSLQAVDAATCVASNVIIL